jgi:diguanylate cyclase (GGDEF)-like protein
LVLSSATSQESRRALKDQPRTRVFILAIFVGCLISLFASLMLMRMSTFQKWSAEALLHYGRLEVLVATPVAPGTEAAFIAEAGRHLTLGHLQTERCLKEVLPIERSAAVLVGAAQVFKICKSEFDTAVAAKDKVARAVAGELTAEELRQALVPASRAFRRESEAVFPLLNRYTQVISSSIVAGTLAITGVLIWLAMRQSFVITEIVAATRRLNVRLANAIGSVPDGFAIFDPNGFLVDCNDAYRMLSSRDPDSIRIGMHYAEIHKAALRDGFYANSPDLPSDQVVALWWKEAASHSGLAVELSDGRFIRIHIATASTGEFVVTRVDQTQIKRRETEAARAARTDVLTGLPNRRHFDEIALSRMLDERAGNGHIIIVRIDLDNFKYVNDSLGHEAGDRVLQHVARALRSSCEADDFAARLGGDEFLVMMAPGASTADADALIGRIRARLDRPMTYKGHRCRFGASFGVASSEIGPRDMAELMSFADVALYEAKRRGRGSTRYFNAAMLACVKTEIQTADEIRAALERDELVPYLQPQIDARTGRLTGFEVLARWQHPTRGLLPPGAFLGVAEKLRIVPDIDRAIFEGMFAFVDRLQERGLQSPQLSFNLSVGRLRDADLVDNARRLIARGAPVTFEILESVAVEDEQLLNELPIDALRSAGVSIEIDDFGSGHASIVGLLALRPDGLKIDRRLVHPMLEDAQSCTMIRAIIDIARSMGLHTVAEGVECVDQAARLTELGVDYLQGFAISRPISLDAALVLTADPGPLLPLAVQSAPDTRRKMG